MKRAILITAVAAALGWGALNASALTYTELASGTFGSATLPGNAQEYYHDTFGFGAYYYDIYGRVISNAAPTTTAPGALTQINMNLWSGTDVDLFQIQITDPSTFTAYIANSTNKLVLFNSLGKALAGVTGGASASTDPNVIKGSDIPGLVAGTYYIGESNPGGQPFNSSGTAIFDFSSPGEVFPLAGVTDQVLSSDPFQAWGLSNGASLIGPSSFTSGQTSIFLSGASAVVTPEPASLALASVGALGLFARRRRVAR
ncbi:MAG: PEP-CTERM sorting domain-containing protein [Phycisphaerae bacterium]